MNESITAPPARPLVRSRHGASIKLIEGIGRVPDQRDLYGEVPAERVAASFCAAPLAEVVTSAAAPPRARQGARRLVRFG